MFRRFALLFTLMAALVQPFGLGGARLQSLVEHAMVHASVVDHHHHDGADLQVDEGSTDEAVFHLHPDEGAASAPPPVAGQNLGHRPTRAAPAWVAMDIPSPDLARHLRPPQSLS